MMNIELRPNEYERSVTWCSATELTSGSSEFKNGFSALIYLKEGKLVWLAHQTDSEAIILTPEIMNATNTAIEFLIRVASLLNVWIIRINIIKMVGSITRTPP